jgi:hypothetical protein
VTPQQVNASLTKVRLATNTLADLAVRSNTFEQYIVSALDYLKSEWPDLDAQLVTTDATSSKTRTLALNASEQTLLLELPALDGAEWEALRLWSQFVTQVWTAKPQTPTDRQLKLYRGLTEVAHRVNRELANEQILIETCRAIVESVDEVDHAGVVLNDNAPISGTVVAEYPDFDNIGVQLKLRGYKVFERMENSLEPIVINNVAEANELLGENYDIIMGAGIKSMMILPITIQNSLIGSIGLDVTTKLHTFTKEEVEVLGSIATQIALGIHNAELFDEISSRIVSEALTTRVTERLPLRSDLNTLLQTAARELGLILGATRARIVINTDYTIAPQVDGDEEHV